MKLLNTALIKLALALIIGILTGFYVNAPFYILFPLFGMAFFLFIFAFIRARRLFFQDSFFGVSTLLLFFLTGIVTTGLHLPKNQPQHYLNQIPSEEDIHAVMMLVSIKERLKTGLYSQRYIAEVKRYSGNPSHGKILLLLPKDNKKSIEVDDLLLISSEGEMISAPLNPHRFNYREFMANRDVFRQINLHEENYDHLGTTETSIQGIAERLRTKIVLELEENNFQKEELAIIQALLLGQKEDISSETYDSYAAAGVIHILAVSGLHVGIILMVLHWLLFPLSRIKNGKILKTLVLVFLLWGFAVLAGLSPSVVRAVTMFTFVAIGLEMKRRTSVLNTLFLSLMLLLLIKPQLIFEVGFQLSYLAVFSIVLIQPPLYKLFTPKNKLLKYFWGLFTVTLAAQAGVFPLSLFYFHQFPGLFFISNLVILPFLGLILAMGIAVMLLALLEILPQVLVNIYGFFIESLNKFVDWVAQQENFLFENIPFSILETLAFYFFLGSLIMVMRSVNYSRIMLVLCSILLLQSVFLYENYHARTSELIVFHKSRNTIIGEKRNEILCINHNLKGNPREQNLLKDYVMGEKIDSLKIGDLKNIYGSRKEFLLVIDSTAIYPKTAIQKASILLISSPQLNLERLILELQPSKIIADGSNYKSYVSRWRKTCEEQKIPFHYTGEKGAFILQSSR